MLRFSLRAQVDALAPLPAESAGGAGADGPFVRKSFTVPMQPPQPTRD